MDYIHTSLVYISIAAALMSSPMMISATLVLISLLISLHIGAFFSKWFMFVLLLVFTGGMMIMVLYIANLAAGLKIRRLDATALLAMIFMIAIPLSGKSMIPLQAGSLLKSYSWEILLYLMAFLLFGLFLIVFIVDKSFGALR